MSISLLEAHGLAASTPDGLTLFSQLDFALERQVVALVGRNGCGKSTLARILAGRQEPDAGRVTRHGRIGWLPQEMRPAPDAGVIDLLGQGAAWRALRRVQAGSCAESDFEAIGDHWDLEARLDASLARFGLSHLDPEGPASRCSGGEATSLGLVRLLLERPDLLILDEPTNHLDAAGVARLSRFLSEWPGAALVVTHHRGLLERIETIFELSAHGLRRYPGPWSIYRELKEGEEAAAGRRHEVARAEQRLAQRRRQAALERQQRRVSRGRKDRQEANQAKLLLDFGEQGSEATTARLRRRHAARVEEAGERERQAREAVEHVAPVSISPPPSEVPQGRRILALEQVTFGFGARLLWRELDIELIGSQRLALLGPNGCGKSTLLKLIRGELHPLSGRLEVCRSVSWLDQHQSLLDEGATALENYRRLAPGLSESEYRGRLARLRLGEDHLRRAVANLSGGERLKVALAAILLGNEAPELLLLDEPTNHQDLESITALERAIAGYDGALVVVSHDQHFLANIGITHEIRLDASPPRALLL